MGTGAWGTTFAQVLADAGATVRMWGRNPEVVEFINSHENSRYLPGIDLPETISATTDQAQALHEATLVALVVPVAAIRQTAKAIVPHLADGAVVMALAKGLEPETLKTVHDMLLEETGLPASRLAVLSGPNLSREIADRNPTATVIASESMETAAKLSTACQTDYFRPYASTDIIGCEIAGATKNIIALAIGAAEGMGLGVNTRSTLITRGLAEMTRLGTTLGARPDTFAGLAGIGDLVATCSSKLSRNYSLGYRMGTGMSLQESLELSPGVAEGARSAKPVLQLAQSKGVDMPITEAVVKVIHEGMTIDQMGEVLMGRPLKADGWRIELI